MSPGGPRQPRPMGPLSRPPSLPSQAGPVAEQLNSVAGKLADYMRHSLEDIFRDLSGQLELEKMLWRHQPRGGEA